MATIKISALPEVSTLATSDLLTAVASNVSSKITLQNFSNTITQVSSSISSSYAITASYALNAAAVTATFPYTGSAIISGSLRVTGSVSVSLGGVTSSLFGTASWSTNSTTASFVTSSNVRGPYGNNSILSASFAVSASWAPSGGGTPGGNTTELQYNNAGAFGGVSTAKFDGATLTVTGSFTGSLVGALTGTASWAQNSNTASFVNSLNQNLRLTGSLVVSGANGAGVFSQGATLIDYIDGISNSGSYMVWRAPFSCSVVGLYGYYVGGTSPQVNALRSGSSGIGRITGSNLTLSSQNVWIAALPNFQNSDFNIGDGLTVIMSGSANNQLAVQVDFIRKF